MKTLKAIPVKNQYYEHIEKEILNILKELIYKPLKDIMAKYDKKIVINAQASYLIKAILSGKVQYHDGKFEGKFDSFITRDIKALGGKFNRITGSFSLPQEKLTADVSRAVGAAYSTAQQLSEEIRNYLNNLEAGTFTVDMSKRYEKAIELYNKEIEKSFGRYQKNIIPVKLTDDQKRILAAEYSRTSQKPILGQIQRRVEKLREVVKESAFEGYRGSTLVKGIMKSLDTDKTHAKFIARQETSLLLSKLRETRYKDVGIKKYRWSTSGDGRVRDRHKHLQGGIFDWDNPPRITADDETPARYGHPGEDFNCRCVAIPIVD